MDLPNMAYACHRLEDLPFIPLGEPDFIIGECMLCAKLVGIERPFYEAQAEKAALLVIVCVKCIGEPGNLGGPSTVERMSEETLEPFLSKVRARLDEMEA